MGEVAYRSPVEGDVFPLETIGDMNDAFERIEKEQAAALTIADPVRAGEVTDAPLSRVPMREDIGAFMTYHPQALILQPAATAALNASMREWFRHYPEDNTFAQREHGVPMLLTRFDGTVDPVTGRIGLCEWDDVPTGFNALDIINPDARSHVDGVLSELEVPVLSAFLEEDEYEYPHDDHYWLQRVEDVGHDGQPVLPRARRVATRFEEFIDQWGQHSIVAGRERDNKAPLIGMGLGALAISPGLAIEFAEGRRRNRQETFIKALKSSRTEAGGLVAHEKQGLAGASTPNQMRNKLNRAGIDPNGTMPMVVMPFHRPPTMEDVGLRFRPNDSAQMAEYGANMRGNAQAEKAVPGNEDRYSVLSRIYGVYSPATGDHRVVGGMWMARPDAQASIHGASDAITGPFRIANLGAYSRERNGA